MSKNGSLENKLIVFELDKEEYAVPVQAVGSIERILPITRVPGTPRFVKGVINLRGVVTPVIDLKHKVKNQITEFTEQTRIIIVNVGEITIGFIVDSANDVLDIQTEQIEAPPEAIGTEAVDYIKGVIKLQKRLFILLDLDKVLLQKELDELSLMEG